MNIFPAFAWIASILLLLVAASHKFNTPPTQRSGTTFFLFYCGLSLYYLLLLILWMAVIVLIEGGLFQIFGQLVPQIKSEFKPAVPLLAALTVVLGYINTKIQRADAEARRICSEWAAIPREKDALALEIREHATFEVRNDRLMRAVVTEVQNRDIETRAVNFSGSADAAALFTRALTLYSVMFVQPWNRPFRSFMTGHKSAVSKAQAGVEGLVPLAQDYFRLEHPTPEVTEQFTKRVGETLGLLTQLVSRAVLATERTKKGRYRRLADFGFWLDVPGWRPSLDLIVAIIGGAAIYFCLLFMVIPRPESRPLAEILYAALPIAVEIGVATALGVQAAIWSERRDQSAELPPLALWLGIALVAAALCGMIRLVIAAVPYLHEGLRVAVALGWEELARDRRWAWRVMSAFIAFGLAVACHRAFTTRASLINLTGDALVVTSFVVMGGVVVKGLAPDRTPEWVWLIVSTGLLGLALGATIPPLYRRGALREAQLRQSVNLIEDVRQLPSEGDGPADPETGVSGTRSGGDQTAEAPPVAAAASSKHERGPEKPQQATGRGRLQSGKDELSVPRPGLRAGSPPKTRSAQARSLNGSRSRPAST